LIINVLYNEQRALSFQLGARYFLKSFKFLISNATPFVKCVKKIYFCAINKIESTKMNNINCISSVKIKGLWNKLDLVWKLNPDVNILSGINGSGKSTILSCIAHLLQVGQLHYTYRSIIREVIITFDNNKSIDFKYLKMNDTIKNLEIKAETDPFIKRAIEEMQEIHGDNLKGAKSVQISKGITSFENMEMKLEDLHKQLKIDAISTFDKDILDVGRRPDESVRTELDRDIFKLQKQYLDFQLNIGKKAFEIMRQNKVGTHEAVLQIRKKQDRFLEIIDNLFNATDKRINRDKNEIMFLSGKEELTAYQLSSGEKQILVILLTVLVQDNKPAILFMDEPEVSLHFDWQKKLIGYIRELNPAAQIILATHSPAVIMEGWRDKVMNVKDLIVSPKTKTR
jgi:predicted ATPase